MEKRKRNIIDRYRYDIGYKKSSDAPPGGAPELSNWYGFYIQAWNDSDPNVETFRTDALFSLNEIYLKIGMKGESIFKRK